MAKEKTVNTTVGIALLCLTILIVLGFGALFSAEYESTCTTNEGTGKSVCTTRSAWKGWSALPIQALAGASGAAAAGFAAFKTARKQDDDPNDPPPTNVDN